MKCRCNGSSGTDCYWCGTKGSYKRIHIAEQPVQVVKPIVEPKQIPMRERLNALQTEIASIGYRSMPESLAQLRLKFKKLFKELAIYRQQLACKERIAFYTQQLTNMKQELEEKVKRLHKYQHKQQTQLNHFLQ